MTADMLFRAECSGGSPLALAPDVISRAECGLARSLLASNASSGTMDRLPHTLCRDDSRCYFVLSAAGARPCSPLTLHWLLYRLPLAQAGQPPVYRVLSC